MQRPSQRENRPLAQRLVVALGLAVSATALGQVELPRLELPQRRTIFIQNARVITGTGAVLEGASVVIRGDRIEAVGPGLTAPDRAEVIDGAGLTVAPGIIDADGALGMTVEATAPGDPTLRAWDAFDRFATEDFRQAVRQGVTAVHVRPASGPGILGVSAVVRLAPGEGGAGGVVMEDSGSLCIDLGSDDAATRRLATLAQVRAQLRGALDYRESVEAYKEQLEEYEKKVKERAEKEAKNGPARPPENRPSEARPAETKPADAPAPGEARPGEETPPDRRRPGDERRRPRSVEEDPGAPQLDEPELLPQPERTRPPGAPQPGGPPAPSGGAPASGEKKEEEIKKPVEPTPDRKAQVLLKALDGELPVRISAQASADILNALDLAREFGLRNVTIVGGRDADLVAKELAAAEAKVVLTPGSLRVDAAPAQGGGPGGFGPGGFGGGGPQQAPRPTSPGAPARRDRASALAREGVSFVVASGGGSPLASRFTLLAAQDELRGSMPALESVTHGAGELLGVGESVGTVRRGELADLVIWKGDPSAPGARVVRVLVGGQTAFRDRSTAPEGGRP